MIVGDHGEAWIEPLHESSRTTHQQENPGRPHLLFRRRAARGENTADGIATLAEKVQDQYQQPSSKSPGPHVTTAKKKSRRKKKKKKLFHERNCGTRGEL